MQITANITFDSAAEAAAFFSAQGIPGTPVGTATATLGEAPAAGSDSAKASGPKGKATAKDKVAAATPSPAPAATASTANDSDFFDSTGETAAAAPAPTYEDVVAALMAFSKKVDRDTFAALLTGHGVAKVPELKDAKFAGAYAAIIAATQQG
jgi:hypothetical protein